MVRNHNFFSQALYMSRYANIKYIIETNILGLLIRVRLVENAIISY